MSIEPTWAIEWSNTSSTTYCSGVPTSTRRSKHEGGGRLDVGSFRGDGHGT
ncbi:MAG TPA: hypothetical protein VM095_13560 [Pyrinomonadaceae bacterium]|nr:hypothetical protein [Pyrinomonadaceae bacterium]